MLEVRNVSTNYGPVKAIRGISFEVPQGSIVALIGSNAAGKTTTLNTISGLLKPVTGTIKFCGRDITGWRADLVVKQGIIQVPEGRAIIVPLTVQENLELGAYVRRDVDTRGDIKRAYERFPALKGRASQRAGSLSGGEQQMLAIARALMSRPKLLMLDEPSTGLAPLLVSEIFSMIREINRQGTTILLVEQNVRKALEIASYAYVLERGEITHEGLSGSLLHDTRVLEAYLG